LVVFVAAGSADVLGDSSPPRGISVLAVRQPIYRALSIGPVHAFIITGRVRRDAALKVHNFAVR
jgi:hypothetical protein